VRGGRRWRNEILGDNFSHLLDFDLAPAFRAGTGGPFGMFFSDRRSLSAFPKTSLSLK
jgi:hypothetical protein